MLSKLSIALLVIIIFAHGLVLTKLIYFPYPEIFVYPYLTNHNLKPYQQILDQHFPGLMFLPINFDNLGMKNEDIAREWSITVIILIHLLLFFISSKILKSKPKALLVNFLYFIWQPFFEGWVLWIDSFLPIILLPSFYALYKKRLFICGLLLGLGIVFKQTLIPLSFLILIYIVWQTKSIKQPLIYLTGLLGPILLMIVYIINIGVVKDFWYWTIVFNLTVYAKSGTTLPSSLGFIIRALFVYIPAFLVSFHKDKKLVGILFVFLVGSLSGIFDRANFIHFQPSLPFAILATGIGFYEIKTRKIFKKLIVLYLIVIFWWLIIFYKGHLGSKVFFFDQQTKLVVSKIKQYTKPEEKIFVFGAVPHIYQMADRLPAGNIFVFPFPWFLKVSEDRILAGLIHDPPKIIIADRVVEIEGQKITDFAGKLDQYIQQNYERFDNVGTIDILRFRKP